MEYGNPFDGIITRPYLAEHVGDLIVGATMACGPVSVRINRDGHQVNSIETETKIAAIL